MKLTKYEHSCFTIEKDERYFVDPAAGLQILKT